MTSVSSDRLLRLATRRISPSLIHGNYLKEPAEADKPVHHTAHYSNVVSYHYSIRNTVTTNRVTKEINK